ncbi:MAG: ABC transporter ATP-binding protein/permease [Sphingobium sp.]|nr:ABC transporter ATP-binding protein/permease [Sphingobium sp.]
MTERGQAASVSTPSMRAALRLLGGYWVSSDKYRAWLLLATIIALKSGSVWCTLQFSLWNKRLYDAIGLRNLDAFWQEIFFVAGLSLISVLFDTFAIWFRMMLQMRWRVWLNEGFLSRWLENKTYYRIERSGKLDNPDQRIGQDLALYTEKVLEYGFEVYRLLGTIFTLSVVLWGLSRNLSFDIGGSSWHIPGLAVWVMFAFVLGGSAIVEWVGKPLNRSRYDQQKYEADYRFDLVRIRENAEPVALYAGEQAETARLNTAFSQVQQNWRKLVGDTKRVMLGVDSVNQFGQVIPYLVATGGYFSGNMTLGDLTQMVQACLQIRIGLSWFVVNYRELAELRATSRRISEFDLLLQGKDAANANAADGGVCQGLEIVTSTDKHLRTSQLVLTGPGREVLTEPVSLAIAPGTSNVICGPSGCGKSTLLLALAGLWSDARGRIELPDCPIMFIPQRPYVPTGMLKAALVYPALGHDFSDEQCREALEAARLSKFSSRLHDVAAWQKCLSPGEQQRLAFARIFLHQPGLVFLDETTSALDQDAEEVLYRRLRERQPDLTIVSVAHRSSVIALHDEILRISSCSMQAPDQTVGAGKDMSSDRSKMTPMASN